MNVWLVIRIRQLNTLTKGIVTADVGCNFTFFANVTRKMEMEIQTKISNYCGMGSSGKEPRTFLGARRL